MNYKLAVLGPEGSYSYLAALKFYPEADFRMAESIAGVFELVRSGVCQQGLVPTENSTTGRVAESAEVFERGGFEAAEEHEMPIEHCLAALSGVGLEDIGVIYSHLQALKQCANTLKNRFPQAEPVAVESTSGAIEKLGENSAVICSEQAAESNGLSVLQRAVQDDPNNVTRFTLFIPSR